jgi:HlyD family secretion protein
MKNFYHVILVVLAAALLSGCGQHGSGAFQGYIEGEYVYIASPLGGALTNLAVARGDSVKAGQSLFMLERQSEAAALTQAGKNLAQVQAQLADLTKGKRPSEIASLSALLEQAKASLKLAESELARREKLLVTQVVSEEEIDQARTQKDSAEARVAQVSADLETAKLGGRDDVIRAAQAAVEAQQAAFDKAKWAFDQKQQSAPAAGTVHDTLYRAGEWVAAGSPVAVLLPLENLKVRFFVPQDVLPRIKVGESVSIHCDGAPREFKAVVNYISSQAEFTPPVIYSRESRATIVFMIEAKISLADSTDVRPGQPVDVTLN